MFDIVTYKSYEKYFSENHENSYELLSGTGPVMISAPHSVEQTRNGSIKYAEPQTGALAKMLHEELGCPVIYKTGNKGDDANFDEESSYKNALIEYVKNNNILFVLDLHQLAPFRDVIIDIGTGKFNNIDKIEYVNIVLKSFSARKLGTIQIDTPFDASFPFTVSSFVAKTCGISCLQIEMNSNTVYSGSDTAEIKKVFDALSEIIMLISKSFLKD